jgi:hypothetical protein
LGFFGKENIRLLNEAIKSPEVEAVDTLCLSGDMSVQEALEYVILIPEIRAVFERVSEAVKVLCDYVKERKLPNYLSRIEKSKATGMVYDSRPIDTFFEAIPNFFIETVKKMNPGRFTTQTLVGFAIQEMYRELTVDTYRFLEAQGPKVRDAVFEDFAKRQQTTSPTEGEMTTGEALQIVSLFEHSKLKASLQSLATEEVVDQAKLEELFDEIADLSVYRTIQFKHAVQGFEFEFSAEQDPSPDFQLAKRMPEVCVITVKKTVGLVPGDLLTIPLTIERFTGQLNTAMVTHLSGHIGVEAEQKLRLVLFRALREHLASKDEDIKPAKPIAIRERKVGQENSEPVHAADDLIEEMVAPETAMSAPKIEFERPAGEDELKIPKKEKITLYNLKGITGGRIKDALCALLGEPIRVSGSHHVFTCRSGGTFPIPLHESATVGTGVLGKCLKRFGVTPAELKEQLS